MQTAFKQFEETLRHSGKQVCRWGETCSHGDSAPDNVLHINESQLAQATMLALLWVHLHPGDLVKAILQALGQLTSSSIAQTDGSIYTFVQQYQPVDLTEGCDAENTFTWIVGQYKETGVGKKRLKEVIKHILGYRRPAPAECRIQ